VEVRLARTEDLSRLAEVEKAANLLFHEIGFDLEVSLPVASRVPAPAAILVARDPPVGFATVEAVDGRAHLEELAVHPDHGRRGIGRALLEAAIAWAEGAGFEAMTLCTFRDVEWNGPFYASAGFSPMGSLSPDLEVLREKERLNGLDELGPRVVMLRLLNGSSSFQGPVHPHSAEPIESKSLNDR